MGVWGQTFCFPPKFPQNEDHRGKGWYRVKLLEEAYKRWEKNPETWYFCHKNRRKQSGAST